LLGIGLSASQLLSAGASTPLKVGASVMKVAKKSGKLTKPFMKTLTKKLNKSVDTKVLKSLNIKRILHLQESIKIISKAINTAPLKALFKEVSKIKKYTSTVDTISLMKYVDTPKHLKHIAKLSKRYKSNTKAVMKVLGKGALKSGKSIVKYTSKLIAGLLGFLFSTLVFISVLLSKMFFWFKVKKHLSY